MRTTTDRTNAANGDPRAAASAGMYRLLFEGSPHANLIVDQASGRVVRANRAAARKYGYTPGELTDLSIEELWPHGKEIIARAHDGGDARVTAQHRRKQGARMAVSVAMQLVAFAGRAAVALHVVEAPERAPALAVLQAQTRLLEMVARGEPLARVLEEIVLAIERLAPGVLGSVLLLDDDGRHARHGAAPSLPPQYWSAVDGVAIGPAAGSCGAAMALARPVLVEDIASDPLWKDYRALALPHGLRACWSMPILSRAGSVLGAFAMYYRHPGLPPEPDLGLVEVAAHLAAVAIERDRADRVVQASEGRMRAIIDHAFAAIWLKDTDGRYLLVNRRFEEISGVPAAVALGRTDRQLFPRELAEACSAHDREVLQARRGIEFEEEFEQADGVHVYLAVKFPLLDASGRAYGLGAVLSDITERRHAEKALLKAREEERTRIAREIHDELGQMLTALHMSQASLIRTLREPAPVAEGMGAELESMQAMVGGMLGFVRRIATELRPELLDKLGLAAAVEWQAAEFTRRTAIPCHVSLPRKPVRADRERCAAIFRTLQEALTNVARHAGATEVHVEVREDEAALELRVADNGRGIPQERSPDSLGLLGMRERAATLGGAMSVLVTPGGGTTIAVRLPAA